MADTLEPEPPDATPADESAGELAKRGPEQHLSEEEVAELEARIRKRGRRSQPSTNK
jgi:hypothetical protein